MAWQNLEEDLSEMFSVLEVPVLYEDGNRLSERRPSDIGIRIRRVGLDVEHLREYNREYQRRPDVRAHNREYQRLPEVKARRNARDRARRLEQKQAA